MIFLRTPITSLLRAGGPRPRPAQARARPLAHPKTQKHDGSYARVSAISKDSFEIACNIYWDVSGGNEEKDAREKLLLDVSRLAKELSLDFYEPRMRASRE